MKKILLSSTLFAICFGSFAQSGDTSSKEGKVVYEDVMKLDIKIEGMGAQFADQLPKERKSKKELIFTENVSLYQNIKEEESAEDIAMEGGGAMFQMKMMEPDNRLFLDIKKLKVVEKQEFMTRVFLIEGDIKQGEWKVTGEQKVILDYPCMQAVKENEEGEKTFAWFTPSIPVATGPSEYVGLPGLVLQVESGDGDRVLTAKSIEFTEIDKKLLVKPKKGKKVTREEFDDIVAKKMEEMGAEHGEGGGTFMIHIER